MTEQEYKDIYDVVGTAMEVYNTLGRGRTYISGGSCIGNDTKRNGI